MVNANETILKKLNNSLELAEKIERLKGDKYRVFIGDNTIDYTLTVDRQLESSVQVDFNGFGYFSDIKMNSGLKKFWTKLGDRHFTSRENEVLNARTKNNELWEKL